MNLCVGILNFIILKIYIGPTKYGMYSDFRCTFLAYTNQILQE